MLLTCIGTIGVFLACRYGQQALKKMLEGIQAMSCGALLLSVLSSHCVLE